MEEILKQLKKDFCITHTVDATQNGKAILTIECPWKGKTSGVEYVQVYLSGEDPLSGEPVPQNKVTEKFSAICAFYRSGALDFYGVYSLHFDAILENGETVKDFREPIEVEITATASRPFIHYAEIEAPKGWKGLTFETNCWRRCRGKLWAKYNGHYQLLPDFYSKTATCYFPVSSQSIELYCSDSTLPEPQRT